MPVPSSIADLSTNPSLNSPAGSESPSTIDDYLRTHAAFIKQINDVAATKADASALAAKADDSAVVKLTGAQAVAGTKTFSASPVVPDATDPKHPVTKDQLDAKAPIASPAFTGGPTAPNPATGTRSQAIATMQKFADEFASSLAANGYQKLPSGLIIQWGITGALAAGQSALVTFPISFPNTVWSIVPCAMSASNSVQYAPTVFGVTETTFNVGSTGSGYSGITWMAIGR